MTPQKAPRAGLQEVSGDSPSLRRELRRRSRARMWRGTLDAWELFRRNRLGMLGVTIIVFFGFLAAAAPILPWLDGSYHPVMGFSAPLSPPELRHPLGTDWMGRDILSQFMFGARIALLVGVVAAVISVFIGTVVGLVSGYFGSAVDMVLMRVADIFLSLPTLPLMLILAAFLGQSIRNIILIIAILGWMTVARVVRSQVLSLKTRPFVEAARVSGASHLRIVAKHLAPNVLPLAFLYMTFQVVTAITFEAAISVIGLGDTKAVSWGMMLQWLYRSGSMFQAPWWLIPPGAGISLLTLAFFLVGRALEEIINPRLRER